MFQNTNFIARGSEMCAFDRNVQRNILGVENILEFLIFI